MKTQFSFDPEKHKYWEIYDCIKEYYPIGIAMQHPGVYLSYPGILKLEELVRNKIGNQAEYKKWQEFSDGIAQKLGMSFAETTYRQGPSLSSKIFLNKEKHGQYAFCKELHFSVCVIGNFFQIYGKDMTIVKDTENKKGYVRTNVVTVSPYAEFEDSFHFVEKSIRENFPGYKIIPHYISTQYIKGLDAYFIDMKDTSINHALFNKGLEDLYSTRGNELYGLEDWVVK